MYFSNFRSYSLLIIVTLMLWLMIYQITVIYSQFTFTMTVKLQFRYQITVNLGLSYLDVSLMS